MARPATGNVEYRNNQWWGRVAGADGRRVRVHLGDWPNSPQGKERAKEAALAWKEKLRERRLGALPRRGVGRGAHPNAGTCEAWFETWIANRRARGHTSTREDEAHYRKYVVPTIGPKHVRDWTPDDLRALSRDLDRRVQAVECSWKTARNAWARRPRWRRMRAAQSSTRSASVPTTPRSGFAGPDRGAVKAKQYLYPSEFQRFVTCDGVPLEWRRAVTLAIYLFPRASELRVLRWEDVDLEHGTVHIHRGRDRNTGEEKSTKGRFARRFAIEPTLLPLLRAMHDESRGHGVVTELWSERNMAAGFRRWLKRAGADRAELHCSTRTRKAIRFHDLRATGLTWMAVRGDDPLKIMQRAGHTDFQTTQLYVREAEAVRDGFGEVFPALPPTLLAAPNRVAYGPNGSGRAPVSLREPIPNDAAQVACAAAEIPESERRPRQPIERNEWPTKRPRRRTIRHLGVRSSTTAVPPDVLNAADLSWTVPSTTASNPALSADQFRGLAPATKGGAQTHSGCTPWRCHERVYPAGPCYSTMTCEVESDSRKES